LFSLYLTDILYLFNAKLYHFVAETECKKKIKEAHIQGIDPPPKRKNITPPNRKLKKVELQSSTLPNMDNNMTSTCKSRSNDDAHNDDDIIQSETLHETSIPAEPSSSTVQSETLHETSIPAEPSSSTADITISPTLISKPSVLTEIEAIKNIQQPLQVQGDTTKKLGI